ncbi:SDR family oxidoreductase [Sphingorhabdus sp.]|uniref:SDR family oxidoreductase n=1 Tax=Sphingorhabdus sp. TaxID=1902408 RepID=UPI0032B73FC0
MTRPLALVTGGMRRLGAVIAAQLADAGYDLALTSHGDGAPDAELAAALEHNAPDWKHFPSDLSADGAVDRVMSDVIAHFGRTPDLLVNNAAQFGQDSWDDMSGDTLDAHFRLNLFAPVLLSRALVQSSNEQAQPAIVHVVDQRITNPNGDQLSYTLSKQALSASVRSLAAAFGKRARVNGVAPGLVIPTDDYDDGQMARLNDEMPLGQLPDAQAIAEAVLYLAKAKHVTGQIVFVDGGAHLRSYKRDFMHL